jgi:hypothetical protein
MSPHQINYFVKTSHCLQIKVKTEEFFSRGLQGGIRKTF